MAITAASLFPMEPSTIQAGDASIPATKFIASGAIARGDVVIFSSGSVATANSTSATTLATVGVVIASAATTTQVMIALALPGVVFEANIIDTGASNDITGTFTTHIGVAFPIATSASIACIEDTASGTVNQNVVRTIRWGTQKYRTATINPDNMGPFDATIAALNPRVAFVFRGSVWAAND